MNHEELHAEFGDPNLTALSNDEFAEFFARFKAHITDGQTPDEAGSAALLEMGKEIIPWESKGPYIS